MNAPMMPVEPAIALPPLRERIAAWYADLVKVSHEIGKHADADEYQQKAAELRSEQTIDWERG